MKIGPSALLVAASCLVGAVAWAEKPSREPEIWREPVTGMEFTLLPAGRFEMGSPVDTIGREEQERLHEVTLSRAFYMGRYEVTRGQWERIMGARSWSFPDCGERCPATDVDWNDAREFARRLRRLGAGRVRLPTEAEWEYACRAGTTTPFATGERLSTDQANFDGRYPYAEDEPGAYRATPTPAGSFPPNAWGLFDFHGNVWEWTEDDHCPYAEGPVADPKAWCGSGLKVIRGGSWYFNADSARCAVRYTHRPQDVGPSLGFRLARDAE